MKSAARICLVDAILLVDVENAPDFARGVHRVFFEDVLDLALERGKHKYRSQPGSNLTEALLEGRKYLIDYGVDVRLDKAASELLKKLKEAEQVFTRSKRLGSQRRHSMELEKKSDAPYIATFRRELKSYQVPSVQHLLDVQHAANFSVPGSGKTTMVYAAFAQLRQADVVTHLIVVGPRACFMPWEDEFAACFGRQPRSVRLTGARAGREKLYRRSHEADLLLVTYQTATNDLESLVAFCRRHKALVVVDESHHIKSFGGGQWANAMLALAPHAARRVILSGTPMPNDLLDLWTQMTFLWPGGELLGNREHYKFSCAQPDALQSIARQVKPFYTRVRKRDLGLPAPRFQVHAVQMAPLQARIYRVLAARVLEEVSVSTDERRQLRDWRRAKLVRLLQAASNPALMGQYSEEFQVPPLDEQGSSIIELIERYPQFEKPSKVVAAVRIVEDLLASGRKVIVWSNFVHNLRMLSTELDKYEPLVLYGAVPRDSSEDEEWNRELVIRDFRNSKLPKVLLANPMACGESVSLHRICHDAVYLDRTFNCGQYMQSLDRIHRIGLAPSEIVTYHLLLSRETVDSVVHERLESKQKQMLALLNDEFPVMSYELQTDAVFDIEEDLDFSSTVQHLRKVVPMQSRRRQS